MTKRTVRDDEDLQVQELASAHQMTPYLPRHSYPYLSMIRKLELLAYMHAPALRPIEAPTT